MDLDFPLILSWAVIISGSIWLVDTFAFKPRTLNSLFNSMMATLAPSRTKASAVAFAMPAPAPVKNATFPSSLPTLFPLHFYVGDTSVKSVRADV